MTRVLKKDAAQWSNAELDQWAREEIETAKPLTERQLADEVIKRRGLEGKQSVEDIKALLRGDEVEEEVKEEVQEEPVEEKPSVKKEETAKKEPAPVKETKPLQKLAKGGNENELSLEVIQQNLEEYAHSMRPGRAHRGAEGPLNQVKLYRTVQMVLRQKGANFHRAFGYLLDFVNEHRRDVFNEMYVFRYFDSRQMKTSLPAGERRKFERILNLLITTCNPRTRSKTLEQVDIDATMETFKDPDMHQRVLGFYKGL